MKTELYHQLETAIRNQNAEQVIKQSPTSDDIRVVIRQIMRDNPDIFWFAHQYYYDKTSSTIHFQYTFSVERVKTIQQSIKDVTDNDFRLEYVKTLTRQEQVAYVYKWLVTYCNYNTNSAYNQSIYSVFIRRNSVCTGYAKSAQYLFNILGIKSRLVFGRLHNDKEDGRHCWNIVEINNQYYHFDVCFGDSILDNVAIKSGVQELFKIDCINYNFLCVSTNEILKTRSIEDITTLPDCPNSWSKTLINSLALIKLKQRGNTKGCLLSHIGSSADIYLCSKDKNIVLKVFRPNSKTTSREEYHYMQQTRGCRHLLQCNEDYTDIAQNTVAIEQSTPIVDLLCSHYYELSLKGLIEIAIDVAAAWKECQERGVLYRDIHICNIYRSDDGTFKLGDFGSCTNDFDIKETVGNQWFMAPETFVSGIFTEASAVYSISMVMYFILNNLRPAFWVQGCEEEALKKRMNGCVLPTPIGYINIPSHLQTKLNNFFRSTSTSFPKERISSIEEFINELEKLKLTSYCEDGEYIIHRKGISLNLDLNRENEDRLNTRWNYIPRDAQHRYAMGDEIKPMCITDKSIIPPPAIKNIIDEVESFSRTMESSENKQTTYNISVQKSKESIWRKLFGNKNNEVYSSIFAPAEVKRKSHLQVQVYLHLYEESEKVKSLAKESDKNAERRDYIPLSLRLKKGDKVDVEFNVYGETRLMTECKSIIWQGSFTKCSFNYFILEDIKATELSCHVLLFVNNTPIGEMRFLTNIVDSPRNLNTQIISHKYKKVFISYAHKDQEKVKSFHEGLELYGIEHFYDRSSLKAGDVFPKIIQDYINSADLFVLFWSENASKSEYVLKERTHALSLAFPQIKPQEAAKLTFYTLSIKPHAKLPDDMKGNYHFKKL